MVQEMHMLKNQFKWPKANNESFTKILCRNQNKLKKAIVKDLRAQG
jgi:hypothetical protein